MKLLTPLIHAFARAHRYLTGSIPAQERIHPDFGYAGEEGWTYNHVGSVGLGPSVEKADRKLVIFLDREDLPKLHGVHFYPAKLAPNDDPQKPGAYCLIVYAVDGLAGIDELEQWAKRQDFPSVSVFSHGYHDARGDWRPGRLIREVR